MVAELPLPPLASTAATVQVPVVFEAVKVMVATPLALVVAGAELKPLQAPLWFRSGAGTPVHANQTGSFALPIPVTAAVIIDSLNPLAVTLGGLAVTVIVVRDVPFCMMTVLAQLPKLASVPVTVQKPTLALAM